MRPFANHFVDDDHCFLCGIALEATTRTDEHVIPGWLQRQHDLWDKRLVLLNGASIPYRQLVIPCCRECNAGPLARLEKKVSGTLTGDYHEIDGSMEFLLFQWSSKMLYGLLRKETSLSGDQKTGSPESIVNPEFVRQISTFHHFMSSIRRPFRFEGFLPFSLFVIETLKFQDPNRNFDYFDFIALGREQKRVLVLAIRVGSFGIICVHGDNAFQKQYFQPEFDRCRGVPLHPIQFLELSCKSACKHALLNFSPTYHSIMGEEPDSEVVVLPVSSPTGEVWRDWDETLFANVFCSLARHRGFWVPEPDKLYVDGKQHTWLSGRDGVPRFGPDDEEIYRE